MVSSSKTGSQPDVMVRGVIDQKKCIMSEQSEKPKARNIHSERITISRVDKSFEVQVIRRR
jgi:hypothetical protein